MTQEMNKPNIIKITHVKRFPQNFCIDWVARNLYWTEHVWLYYVLMKLDFTMWQNGIIKHEKILKMKYTLSRLTIQPSMGYISFHLSEIINNSIYAN